MGFAKIRGKLTSRIGRPVKFSAPQDVHKKGGGAGHGEIVDEVWVNPKLNEKRRHYHKHDKDCWGDYSFCSQLIKWSDGSHSIRLAYFRRRCGENWWEMASQTTVNSDTKAIKQLCKRTLAKKEWFRK